MSPTTTTRFQSLILTALTATVGLGAGTAAGVDRSAFTGRTTHTAAAAVSRSAPDRLTPYQAPTARPIASHDVAFEYLCERWADGAIRCTRVTDHLAALDDDAAERTRDHLGDLQQLFELDDVVALRCEAPFPGEESGEATGQTGPTADPFSTWTSLFGTASDFHADGTLSESMTDSIEGACNVIFQDGSRNSGGPGGLGGLGHVPGMPGLDTCGFELGDTPEEEIAAMAVERMSQMLEDCDATLESQIMDGDGTASCSNEIVSAVCNGDGTEEVCTDCGDCWTRYNDKCTSDETDDDDDTDGGDESSCTPEAGEDSCSESNGDGTQTTCDAEGNCYVEYEDREPTGNCTSDDECVIDNGDGTVTVCPPESTDDGCYVRYEVPGEEVDHEAEEGYVVSGAERDENGDILITTVNPADGSGIDTTISGTGSIIDDEKTSTYCADATDSELCLPCKGPRCRGWRRTRGLQDCYDETCQTCQTLATAESPKIMAACAGDETDPDVCRNFVESTECCADVTGVDVDPRLVRTAPDADYVCVTGEAELAQQHCEEQCWAMGDDCQISCATDYERFLGLKDYDPLEDACWEMLWDGCFVDLPEVEPEGGPGGGVPAPFDAPVIALETATVSTGPISPRLGTTPPVSARGLVGRTGGSVQSTTVQLEPVSAPPSAASRVGVTPRTTTAVRSFRR